MVHRGSEMLEKAQGTYIFHAYHLYEAFRLKEIDRLFEGEALSRSATKLTFKDAEDRYFFIYRFGSVIFFNVTPERREAVIDKLKSALGDKPDMLTSEDFAVRLSDDGLNSVGFEHAALDSVSQDRIELLSLILAQSTSLEYFENKVDQLLGRTADVGHVLKKHGRLERGDREIKKFIGQCITTKRDLVASLYLLDKPDETWEDQVLDKLYREAVDMFELRDRYRTVDYKLKMIQENLELIADLLQYKHANFLEWAIIVLIAIEVVLFVLQLFILES
jgi:uncharacterized Rmd1/YagE family protein